MRLFVIIAIWGALFAIGCSRNRVEEEYRNGHSTARADVAKGYLAIAYAESTHTSAYWFYYEGLLRTNYGVQCYIVTLPANPQAAEAWARGYNEVGQPEIERRFGTSVLQRTMNEAQTIYDQSYPQKKRKTSL
jgi:hypothetical protein